MKIIFILFLISAKIYAACDGNYSISQSGKMDATVSFFVLEPNVPQKFCLKLPPVDFNSPKNVGHSHFIEFQTVNLGNSPCSGVKMTVNPPGLFPKTLRTEKGSAPPAPGIIAEYKPGLWVVKYTLLYGCTKYKALAQWAVAP